MSAASGDSQRQLLQEHLVLAEKHISTGEHALEHQRAVVLELERDGHDSTEARSLLTTMEETQQLHVAGRDRLRAELEELPAS
jgi:hypothetical protein